MVGLMLAVQLCLGTTIIVMWHDLGHFLAARTFRMRIQKFYIFQDLWGFKIFSFKRGNVEYGMGWIPIGGYIKIEGTVYEENMTKIEDTLTFRSKPSWQKLIVMMSGIIMNLILGIFIFSYILLNYEQKYLPNSAVVDGICALELGKQIGLQNGDKILAVDGKPVERFDDLMEEVVYASMLTVDRNGQTMNLKVPGDFYRQAMHGSMGNFITTRKRDFLIDHVLSGEPADIAGTKEGDKILAINNMGTDTMEELKTLLSQNKNNVIDLLVLRDKDSLHLNLTIGESGTMGIASHRIINDQYALKNYTLLSAIHFGMKESFVQCKSYFKEIREIFHEKQKVNNLQGPIGIAVIYSITWDWRHFWYITGVLSVILALTNLLPIPGVDGGYVLFLLYETLTGKKFSDKFINRAQIIGQIILVTLMIFSFGRDLYNALF